MIKNKRTDELMKELSFSKTDINDFISSNTDEMIEINLKKMWVDLLANTGMKNVDIINKSEISYVYFYDIVNGKKIPTTDKVVRLVLATGLTLDECQGVLKYCGKSPLYPRIKRDSILIWAINHKLTVSETNDLLAKENEGELK